MPELAAECSLSVAHVSRLIRAVEAGPVDRVSPAVKPKTRTAIGTELHGIARKVLRCPPGFVALRSRGQGCIVVGDAGFCALPQWLAEGPTREQALWRAHAQGGLTMTAMAPELGLSVSRVSRLIARAEAAAPPGGRGKSGSASRQDGLSRQTGVNAGDEALVSDVEVAVLLFPAVQ